MCKTVSGELLKKTRSPAWLRDNPEGWGGGGSGGKRDVCADNDDGFSLLCSINRNNIVKQVSTNLKINKIEREKAWALESENLESIPTFATS